MKVNCTERGCEKLSFARGFCAVHYQRRRRAGTLLKLEFAERCTTIDCDELTLAKGLCVEHYHQKWYQENLEYVTELHKKWRIENPEYHKDYRYGNIDTLTQQEREWRDNNPDKIKDKNRRRSANDRGASDQEIYSRNDVWAKTDGLCWYCGYPMRKEWELGNPLCFTVDHVVPLSNSGTDTLSNAVPSHSNCNSSKQSRSLTDLINAGWIEERRLKVFVLLQSYSII